MSHPDDGMLAALLDGELTGEEQRMLEAHLRECEVCRARLAEEQAMMAEADGMVEELVLPTLGREVHVPAGRARWARYRPLAWAATVVLAAGLGYYSGEWRSVPGRSALPPAPSEATRSERTDRDSQPAAASAATSAADESPRSGSPAPPAPVGSEAKDDDAAAEKAAGRAALSLQPGVAAEPAAEGPRKEQRADSSVPLLEATRTLRDQAGAARQTQPGVSLPAESGRFAAAEAKTAQNPPAAQRLAAPAAARSTPGNAFRSSTLEDAVKALGGSILLIEGLSPDGVELNSEVPPVARIRYTFPTLSDTVYLEQLRTDASGVTSYDAYNNNMANSLHGYAETRDSLKSVRNGLVFRISGTVGDSVLETLVPRIH